MYLLVWFLPFFVFCLTFCGYFHCWVVIIFCTRSHTHTYNHTYTDLPWRCFLSSSVDCDFFPVILLVFFFAAALLPTTHFPCLSILFPSNMLLADTLFSSLSPIIFAVTAAALFRCVSISVSSLCHADNYFALTLNLSNRALIAQKHSLLLSLPRWCVKVIYCVHCVQTHTYG